MGDYYGVTKLLTGIVGEDHPSNFCNTGCKMPPEWHLIVYHIKYHRIVYDIILYILIYYIIYYIVY